MPVIKTPQSKELVSLLLLVICTIVVLVLLVLAPEKITTIDLNSSNTSVIDDRILRGESVATLSPSNQGIDFSCQIKESHLQQPFCELIIDVKDLNEQTKSTGLDLSSYQSISLWIRHNHSTQPGTRVEIRNYNNAYSEENNVKTLKPNTFEYLEAYVDNPVMLKLTSFSIPQWWQNKYNLSLNNGGTDFSNVQSIVIAPRKQVNEGTYKITVERISLHGQYISPVLLIGILLTLWSFTIGYITHLKFVPRLGQTKIATHLKKSLEFGEMSDTDTGALNRIGLRKCIDKLAPTDLQNLSLIFLNIDYFEKITSKYGIKLANQILFDFVEQINNTCRSSDSVVRWNKEEFLVVCPDTKLIQAVEVANKIRAKTQAGKWPKGIKLSCSSGVAQMYDDDLNDLIRRANQALYSVKNTGSNRTAA